MSQVEGDYLGNPETEVRAGLKIMRDVLGKIT
jgi:hypothetical protein